MIDHKPQISAAFLLDLKFPVFFEYFKKMSVLCLMNDAKNVRTC
ncbi:hypothetical protein PSE_3535 [Pseudovibrio sp. FO-BEG1]|nr:hypothetical protein PSE_3535 [Pseudovibrio sp. FO-BEG1]